MFNSSKNVSSSSSVASSIWETTASATFSGSKFWSGLSSGFGGNVVVDDTVVEVDVVLVLVEAEVVGDGTVLATGGKDG